MEGLVPKRFNWNAFKKFNIRGTYWEELFKVKNDIKINDRILNKFFCEKAENIAKKQSKMMKTVNKNDAKTVSVLDAKSMQNIAIILSTYKLPIEDTVTALLECDEDVIDTEIALKLNSCIQNIADSIDNVRNYKGSLSDISETEIFIVSMVRIPLYDKRISALMFKYNFNSEYTILSDNVNMLKNAYNSIKASEKFKKLMRMVLDIGNFLNFKTPKGNAYGFRLQSLKNMSNVKSKKIEGNTYTLLDYVIINLRDN